MLICVQCFFSKINTRNVYLFNSVNCASHTRPTVLTARRTRLVLAPAVVRTEHNQYHAVVGGVRPQSTIAAASRLHAAHHRKNTTSSTKPEVHKCYNAA